MCGITASIALRRPGHGRVQDDEQSTEPRLSSNYVIPKEHANANVNGTGHEILPKTEDEKASGASGQRGPHALLEEQLNASLDRIAHRGPDSKGIWISQDGCIGFGHNRLSINDLSPDGDQPLHSDDGKIHAIVNGELYDYDRLRDICARNQGYRFKGRSDSELVLALYKKYGAPAFLDHLRGEFALVLYDETTGNVMAARDRFGIKPLFWTVVGDDAGHRRLLFAAEAKAFLPLGWKPEWDVGAIVEEGWSYDSRTLFKDVKKVLPGHWMLSTPDGQIEHHQYWDLDYKDKREVETRSVDDMINGVREQLTEAIKLRLRADVPVGIYLSGGIDSSLLAGIVTHLVRDEGIKMGNQDATNGRVACFSIEFPSESGLDESAIAERTANWLGVQVLKTKVDESVLAHSFADSAYHCEHHNFDLNSVGKFALSTLPREHGFKVVLTGEGADEHFAGYPFFPSDFLREPDLSMPESTLAKDKSLGAALWQNTQASLETAQRKNMGAENVINRASTCAEGDDEAGSGPTDGSVNMSKMPSFVQAWQSSLPLFTSWVRQHWADFDCRTSAINALSDEARAKLLHKWHPLHASEYVWCKSLLPNNLLSCLGDRTEMAHSIEARPPFLDHVLSEYVNGLPPSLKSAYTPERASTQKTGENPWYEGLDMIRDNFTEKWILREAGKPYITEELYKRKKHPYTAPTRWPVGGPLHTTMVQLCTRERVERLGFVDWDVVAYALATAFGDEANAMSFRTLLFIGAWVTLGERFGVKTADAAAWVPAEAPPVKVTVAGGDDVAEKGTAVLQVSECEVPRRSKIVVR